MKKKQEGSRRSGWALLLGVVAFVTLSHLAARTLWATTSTPIKECDTAGHCMFIERTFANYGQGFSRGQWLAEEFIGATLILGLLLVAGRAIKRFTQPEERSNTHPTRD